METSATNECGLMVKMENVSNECKIFSTMEGVRSEGLWVLSLKTRWSDVLCLCLYLCVCVNPSDEINSVRA